MSKHIELLNKIFESSKAKTGFNKGAFIYHEGEVADGVYRVLQGRVKLLKHDTDFKRSIILNIIKEFEIFGLLDFFQKYSNRRCAAIALDKKVVVQYIAFIELEKLIFGNPVLQGTIINFLMELQSTTFLRYHELQVSNSDQILIKALEKLTLNKKTIANGKVVIPALSQQELADYAGLSRQGVSTAMNRLRKKGIIEYDRNQIMIMRSKLD